MQIVPITKKEYKRVHSLQKLSSFNQGYVVFIDLNNKAHRCAGTGGEAIKAIVEHNRLIKKAAEQEQIQLL